MKIHTPQFKENIKTLGRELNTIIEYEINGEMYELGSEELNSVSLNYEGSLLKSVMKQLTIDSNIDIPVNNLLKCQFGVKVNDEYEYITLGNFVVYSSEYSADNRAYTIKCYDKMLYSMVDYVETNTIFPTTVREYLTNICNYLGLEFKNKEDVFANYDKIIDHDLYLDLGYTFRDVLDDIAEATGSVICINDNDELEIRYINETNDEIDEEFLKDVNVNFGEKIGPINSIVLSRSAGSDNIYIHDEESIEQNGVHEIVISDNQIMNFNNRDEYLQDLLNVLDGIEYYLNDYKSTGICYYDLLDMYNVKIEDNTYNCLMLNDEINITQGLGENIFTDKLEDLKTDYSKADTTDRRINQTNLIVDKQNQTIESLITQIDGIDEQFTQIYQDIDGVMTSVQTSGGSNLLKNSVMFAYNEYGEPDEWDIGKQEIIYEGQDVLYNNESITFGGVHGLNIINDTEGLNSGSISGHSFILDNGVVRQKILVQISDENLKNYYTFSCKIKKDLIGSGYVKIYTANEEYKIEIQEGQNPYYSDYSLNSMEFTMNDVTIEFYGSENSNITFTDNMFTIGEYQKQWTQASGEIMNTQVNININGILVKSSVYAGDYTVMSPLEFAGYSNINGIITKVFSLNKDTTIVTKLEAEEKISMKPLKIVPMLDGEIQGWAFVPTIEDGEYYG